MKKYLIIVSLLCITINHSWAQTEDEEIDFPEAMNYSIDSLLEQYMSDEE